ncbi:MAG: GvpL/GvpF family gas vesicle protein [Candidatus Bathyarchaeia archaeon]|jgi:hypothetical protein
MFTNKNPEGRYVYCIVDSDEKTDFGRVGIEDTLVYTLPAQNVDAVVQRCEPKLYKAEDNEKTTEWLLTHQYVIDLATEEFGTVIPLVFNTILTGNDETVTDWLNSRCRHLRKLLQRLEGKQQYGVQFFLEKDFIRKEVEENDEIQRLRKALETNSGGAACLFKILREKSLMLMRYQAKKLCKTVRELVDEIRLEPTEKGIPEKLQDELMILNLSCLVQKNKLNAVANTLRQINQQEGLTVRFNGPWPPYSFVSELKSQKSWLDR